MTSKAFDNVRKLTSIADVTEPAFGAKGDSVTDDSAAITAALASSNSVFVPRRGNGQTIYRVDSEIQVTSNKALVLDNGVILRRMSAYSAATTPVVTGLGIGWSIKGGNIETENASASGVVRLGHLDSTDDRNAWWWSFRNCTVQGRNAHLVGDILINVPSGQVTNPIRANYFGTIQNINLYNGDKGLLLDEMANAHNISNIQYWNIRTACLQLRGAYGNSISNQFFHTGIDAVISIDLRNGPTGSQNPTMNNIIGWTCETGNAADVPIYLDTNAAYNIIIGNNNTVNAMSNVANSTNTIIMGGVQEVFKTLGITLGGQANINGFNVGQYVSHPFNAADFTSDAGTFDVAAGDVSTYGFSVDNKMMTIYFTIFTATLTGPPNEVRIAIPAGKSAARNVRSTCQVNDNGTPTVGFVRVQTSVTYIAIQRSDLTNFALSTNNTNIAGQITFEIN